MHWRNSQSKVRYKFSDLNYIEVLVAEFREPIKPYVPEIVSLLSDSVLEVGIGDADDALSKISDQCKV